MLAKCLWKMYNCDDSVRGNLKRVQIDDVLDSLLDAIDTLPQRRDSRSDPIFEPHFKLVSIVHKLVHANALTVIIPLSKLNSTDSPAGGRQQNTLGRTMGPESQSARRRLRLEAVHP